MLKISALRQSQRATHPATPSLPAPKLSKRELIYSQLRNTTRRLVHPFVTALGWPSAATVYHRYRLLEASILGLLFTSLVFTATLLFVWFAPLPPLVVSLGDGPASVVQSTQPAALPTAHRTLTPTLASPTPQPSATPPPTANIYAVSTPYDPDIYLPLAGANAIHLYFGRWTE